MAQLSKIYLVTNSRRQAWVFKRKDYAESFAKEKTDLAATRQDWLIHDVLELEFSDTYYETLHKHMIVVGGKK